MEFSTRSFLQSFCLVGAILTGSFGVSAQTPTLSSINPTSGDRLQTLNVGFKGSDFIDGVSSVNVGDSITVNTTTVQSSDSLTAGITIKAGAALGPRNFSVTNSGAGTSGNQTFTVNNPSPTLLSINPTSGNRLQTLNVGFKGTNFISGVSTVNVGDSITVNLTTVQRSDSLTANLTIKAGAALGARPFSVSNTGAGTSGSVNFTVNNPTPTLTSINPTSGNRLQTLNVGFKGTNFISGVSTVNVGDSITVNLTTVQRSDSLTANLTIKAWAALGARPFSVSNSGAGTSGSVNFTVNNPAPTLTSINPTSGNRLQTLNVGFKGSNFIAGVSSVNVGDSITVNSTTVQRSDSLTANITIKAGAATGNRSFTVTNSGPGGGTSSSRNFAVNNPTPTLTSINPTSGNRLQTMNVGFKGSNFIAGVSSVNVGTGITVNSTTVHSSDSLTANLTITVGAATGPRNFSVTNTGAGTSGTKSFTVNNPQPTLTKINPTSGTKLQTLNVGFKGSNFISTAVTTVNVGPGITVNTRTVHSSDSLTANLTITSAAAGGARSFSVTNSGPGGGTSETRTFTVNNPAPTLTSINPTSGNRLQTLNVGFKGSNFFAGETSVNVGDSITVNSTTVHSTDSLTANLTINAGSATGLRNFSVTNSGPGGGPSTSRSFTVSNPAPALTLLNPNIGDRLQTLNVAFIGSNFIAGVSSVNVGDSILVNSTTVQRPDSLTANITIKAGAALGPRNFSVTNIAPGGGTSGSVSFTVNTPTPTYTAAVQNQVVLPGNVFQFDLYVLRTGPTSWRMAYATFQLTFNSAAFTSLLIEFVNGSSDLASGYTIDPSITTTRINIDIEPPVTYSTSTEISNSGNGTRIGTFRVSQISNPSASMNLGWRTPLENWQAMNEKLINEDIRLITSSGTYTNPPNFPFVLPPTLISPADGATGVPVDPTFRWSRSNGAISYRLQASTDSTFSTVAFDTSGIIDTVRTVTGLSYNTTYYWHVNATSSGGASAFSGMRSFTTLLPLVTLTSINPASGNRLQTLNVGFKGSNFADGVSIVNVGDSITVNSTAVHSSDSLTANITIKAGAALGPRNFSVTNSGVGTSNTQTFTVNNPAPTLTSINPTSGNRVQTLNVGFKGTNFIGGVSSVNIGDSILVNTTTVNSLDSLTANITIKAGAALGARAFSVTNVGAGTSGAVSFTVANIVVNTKVFLQGPFNGVVMTTWLNTSGYIPLAQPYGPQWGHSGSESVAAIPQNVMDWILVELRTDTSSASRVATRAAFLKSDGSVVDTSGSGPVGFNAITGGSYRIALRHRNHLEIMSADAVPLSTASALYDFSTSQSQAFGTGPMVLVGSSYAMVSGDVDGNGILNASDRGIAWNQRGLEGYVSSDVDLNGICNASDRGIIWNNRGRETQVP